MNLDGKQIWQVAGGDTDRSYVDLFLRWDVIAMGPGAYGRWPKCSAAALANGYTSRKLTDVSRFYEKMKDGDIIVLRLGTGLVYGVGEVVGNDTLWLDDFGDIDGWDLEHVRRVRWLWTYDGSPKSFASHTLKWGDTVQKMNSDEVRNWLSEMVVSPESAARELKKLPESCANEQRGDNADMQRVADFLFDQGIAAQSIDGLVEQMDELVRIARWYQRTGQRPSESETIAYLVVPLLRTLGWTPQKMAVEWNFVDIALFGQTPRRDSNLRAVIEVKKMNSSCLTARSQAESYAVKEGRDTCTELIVTDGLRYAVFMRNKEDKAFPSQPVAYLNLTRTREVYPILECRGARTALLTMAADWNGDLSFVPELEEQDKKDELLKALVERSRLAAEATEGVDALS